MRATSFGSWITAPLTAANLPSDAFRRLSQISCWSTARSTPVGSTKSRFYFSIVQRKALTPNDFSSLADVEDRLLRFQQYYETIAKPFEWKFSRADLDDLIEKIDPAPTMLLSRSLASYVAKLINRALSPCCRARSRISSNSSAVGRK